MDSKLVGFILNTLRKASFRWKPRGESEKRFRKRWGNYQNGKERFGYACAECDEIGMKKDRQMDHIHPVKGPEGFTTFDETIRRMFCDKYNFASLCVPCHEAKTKRETDNRVLWRKSNEEEKKRIVAEAWEEEEKLVEKYAKKYP